MNALHYIFSSFWIWAGTVILVLAVSRIRLVNINSHTTHRNNSPIDDHSVETYNND